MAYFLFARSILSLHCCGFGCQQQCLKKVSRVKSRLCTARSPK